MILKAVPQKKKDEFELIGDIRNLNPDILDMGRNFYVYQFPKLPEKFNKYYFSKSEKVNLFNFTCTCQQFKDNSKIFQERDIRRACKHIYYKASQTWLKEFVGEITLLLLKIATFNSYKYLYKVEIYKQTFYYIISPDSAWIKVITQNEAGLAVEYLYHVIQKRWGHGLIPVQETFVVDQLQKIIKLQFPEDHPLKKLKELEKL